MDSERIAVEVAADGSEARVRIEEGPVLARGELRRRLAAAGVVHGVDAELCDRLEALLADEHGACRWTTVARATPARDGEDGRLELRVQTAPTAGEPRPDGSIDFRRRHALASVERGQELAIYHPETTGTSGHDVRGREIRARNGRRALPRLGRGVELTSDQRILARRAGLVRYVEGKLLDVVDRYEHPADVDFASGNLEGNGTIAVRGSVLEGFAVTAGDDVEIQGRVEDATVRAGGDVTIGGGVIGKRASVHAGGDLVCRHALAAALEAAGTVTVGDHAVDCSIRAKRVILRTGRGRLVGGRTSAKRSIHALEVGAPSGAATVLAVADLSDLRAESARLRAELHRRQRRGRRLAGRDGTRVRGGKAARDDLGAARAVARHARTRRRAEQALLAAAEIVVEGVVHAGVEVRFGTRRQVVEEPIRGVRFCFDSDQDSILMEAVP